MSMIFLPFYKSYYGVLLKGFEFCLISSVNLLYYSTLRRPVLYFYLCAFIGKL